MYELRDNSEHSNSNKENPKIKIIIYKKTGQEDHGEHFFSTVFDIILNFLSFVSRTAIKLHIFYNAQIFTIYTERKETYIF